MIKAILLDFNGVIIDDEPIQMKAYQEVLKEEGIDLTEEQYYDCLGLNDESFVRTIYANHGKDLTDDKCAEIVDAKGAKWLEIVEKRIPLFENIEDFIKRMQVEFSLGVVSMARRKEIEYTLEKTGLKKYFSVILSAENISTTKPDPECYREGFRLIDKARTIQGKVPITRKQCVVIEDSPQGIIAGTGAGLKTLGITNSVAADKLRDAGASAVTDDLSDWSPDSFRRVF